MIYLEVKKMVDVSAIKNHIVSIMKTRGPSLPIQIAKDTKQTSIFASAFLSELLGEKRIKLSNLRVGGTPLYLLEGQEPMLENFKQFLHPKEQEALRLLKDQKVLKDSEQDPAIRVAIRSIKDFAFSFKKDDQIYWRYLTVTESEVKQLLEPDTNKQENPKIEQPKIIINETIKPDPVDQTKIIEQPEIQITRKETFEKQLVVMDKTESKKQEIIQPIVEEIKEPVKPKTKKIMPITIAPIKEKSDTLINSFDNPLAIKPEPPKPEKIKPKSEFVNQVLEFLENNKFRLVTEKDYKAKEYNCIVEIDTDLGPIHFLTLAKDKKSVSDIDLEVLLRQAQSIPLPALFLAPGELNKKAKEYQEKYFSIIKFKKIA